MELFGHQNNLILLYDKNSDSTGIYGNFAIENPEDQFYGKLSPNHDTKYWAISNGYFKILVIE